MAFSNYYFLVLDIETSKHMEFDEKLNKMMPTSVWLSYGFCKLYNIQGETVKKCGFRDWKTLENFYNEIGKAFCNKHLFCYVHNLSYEFDFLIKNISKPKKFLCNSSHNVISATLEKYPTIEYRCTLQLTSKPLRQIGKELNLPKLESEYRDILPDDEITQEEYIYCERDCDIVAKLIVHELEEYNLLTQIPLTNTGRVRKCMKQLLKEYPVPYIWDTLPDENCYDAMVHAYKGALTTSNPQYTNVLVDAKVICKDETSKYPSVMMTEMFPYTIRKLDYFSQDDYKKYKFWIAKVSFTQIYSKYQWGCLSISNIVNKDNIVHEHFNGKIMASPYIEMYITNVDLEYIEKAYNYSKIQFLELYPCDNYDYLPKAFYKLIEMFAKPKYELKIKLKQLEKEGKDTTREYFETELAYGKSKNMLNSIYGMMVQKLVQDEYTIDENYVWKTVVKEYSKSNKRIGRNFLYGIYITAYSRRDLILNIIHNCPYNFVYCDTDSIKYIDIGKPFEDLNKSIRDDIKDLPYFKGFNKFDNEPPYDKFLTYGAKKYSYEKDGVFHYTVAGLPKFSMEGKPFINSFEEFYLGKTVYNCKLGKRFIYCNIATDIDIMGTFNVRQSTIKNSTIDYMLENNIDTKGGVALIETNYTLDMTRNDLWYIEYNTPYWENTDLIKRGS